MKVVLDSNIIVADFWMQSPNFKILFENSKKGEIELFIPQVVIDEILNKFDQRIQKLKSDINGEIAKFEKLSDSPIGFSITEDSIKKSNIKYKKHLDKIIKINGITIIEYPKTSHEFLARKAMLSFKPFNTNEKGYRDCLIWENIKSLVSQEDVEIPATPEVVFITNNFKDFTAEGDKLHDNLISELENENLISDSVIIYPSLKEFNDKVTKLFFSQASIFEGKLKNNEFWDFELKSIIDDYLFKHFIGSDINNYHSIAPYANDNPIVSTISEDFKIDSISVRKLNSKEYIVDVHFKVETDIDYYIDKSDYWSADDIDASLVDSDWNNHVVMVSRLVDLPVEMTLLINSNLECTSIEISKIDDNYE